MKTVLVLSALGVCGCMHVVGPDRAPFPEEKAAIGAAVYTWTINGHPPAGERCDSEKSRWRIRDIPSDRTWYWCGVKGVGGCFHYFGRPRKKVPVATLIDDGNEYPNLYGLCHEALHWLASCAGEAVDNDRLHQGPWFKDSTLNGCYERSKQ